MRVLPAVLLAAACGAHSGAVAPPPAAPAIAIVVSEVGALGARLVVLDEHGDRVADLLAPAAGRVVDKNPAISPDGRSIVFESNRGGTTTLWIAPLVLDAAPAQLTTGILDEYPAWTRDSRAIVFSRRVDPQAELDLFRITLADRKLEQLTATAQSEVTPSVAADGTIYYCAITEDDAHLEARTPDGTIRRVTAGPADTAPAVSPDGHVLVFSRPVDHHGTPDGDLWVMPIDATGSAAQPLVDIPVADESGPVWSPDGKFVLATSAVRSVESHAVLLSSVIAVEVATRSAHVLQDRSGYIARLTPAIAPRPLDRAVLAADPEYFPTLARIINKAMAAPTPRPEPRSDPRSDR